MLEFAGAARVDASCIDRDVAGISELRNRYEWTCASASLRSQRGTDERATRRRGATDDGDFDGTGMRWNHLVLAGDPAQARPEARGNVQGDIFACPDGITFDARGVLWIQTDMSSSVMHQGEMARFGNNQMLACDTASGEIRRFLTGPVGCEITGCTFTPDGRTMFINVQHPGESPSERSDPAQPTRFSTWPDGAGATRPRSATVVIRKADGGLIGT